MSKEPNTYKTKESNNSVNNKPSSQQQRGADTSSDSGQKTTGFQPPVINLPKGGGAIQGIGEKFQANPVTGTGSMTVPIAMSAGRGGFTPQLALSYDSGSGNSPFGLGWDVGLPQISRKTNKGLPQYDGLPKYEDAFESDVFLLSGAEDLIPVLNNDGSRYSEIKGDFTIYRYRPRIEGLFARIEKWVKNTEGVTYWRSITKDNITTIYGESIDSKIIDPDNNRKVFSWLIEKTFDDKGNVIVYQYKKENGLGLTSKPIFEKNRNAANTHTQTYLKRVLYGNTIPYQKVDFTTQNKWLFELVFDFGEHWQVGDALPYFEEHYEWRVRPDIFSSFRSGFDIRTYRLCHQILMFHHFPNKLGEENTLVKATHFQFDENNIATQLQSITHTGYGEAGESKSYPDITFTYTKQKIDEKIYSIHSKDLPNVPQGIDGQQYQFNDLYGEGLNGILKQNGTAWYYKRNLGGGVFAPQELIAATPSLSAGANVQITDFGGDGLTDVMVQTDTLNGYFELNEDNEWSHFKPFARPVNFDLNDPSLRMIDLDGNGIPDILITDDDCFVWYAADALDGFKAARRVAKALDEESGARIVFKESFQTIFLADMKGDGMTDIVRIRNGEICYWANMGYGRFSPKITMAHAPHFDYPDYFDPSRLRLADIDGSGTTDVLYLGRDEITYWLNHSGNSWGEAKIIRYFPKTTNLHTVSVFDLLGNGTACIVWSSPLPAEAHTPMKYVQLMGNTAVEGNKPYLLKEVNNNMGAITRLKYEASTKFYLEDRKLGKPWITKLPFPVQVLIRQEVFDTIAGNHFVSRYAYHHGYFDKVEREFRGFGMVEQWDTEDYTTLSENTLFENIGRNWSEQTDMPPIYTKTWFHNGFYKQGGKISRQYEKEYYKGDSDAWLLYDTELPINLNTDEKREAARALKGRALRVEVYGMDGTTAADHPYTVTESKYHIKTIQNKGQNRHACFYVCACESLSYQYERNPVDPRIAHQSTLEIDEFGNVMKSAAIVYPRRITSIYPEQNRGYVTYSEADFINKPNETDWYRIGVPYAQRSYEITGLTLTKPFDKEALRLAILSATEIPFEQLPTTSIEKRLLAAAKSSFYDETLTAELPFGEITFHTLPYHAYEAVYTEGVLDLFEKDGTPLISSTIIQTEAGFIPMDSLWWRTSGRAIFDAAHFYQPIQQLDPLGHAYTLGYDAYHLAMLETSTQVSGKTVKSSAQLDYRILQPYLMTDPNGNRQALLFDPLGMVVTTAIMGKVSENKGDTLVGYQRQTDPSPADVLANPHAYLQNATSFFHYDLFHWKQTGQPNYAVTIVRETHAADTNGQSTKTQINFSYSDGFGQAIMVKVQAEAGDALRLDNGQVINDFAVKRWVGNGRTVFNNKGKPVKQYEPYFSHTHGYEVETELVEFGVTPILHYDPVGRNIRTDLPDGTFTKVEFTAWEQATFDQNDTVLESNWYSEKSVSSNIYEKRAATLAAAHANTPKVEYLDTLGRVFLLVDDNGTAGKYENRFDLDILGNQIRVTDALGRLITVNHFNMAKEPIHTQSMDAGRRWSLTNSMGNPLYLWNDRHFKTRFEYDELQRNTGVFVSENSGAEAMVYKTIYGEQYSAPESLNLFGQLWELYDQSGRVNTEGGYDFKGNPLKIAKQVAVDYKNRLDWAATTAPALESEIFTTSTEYDALNRPIRTHAPDGSTTLYTYNEANFLEKMDTILRGGTTATAFVENIDYDAKGQRTRIRYGNGVNTRYDYDPKTFRLTRLLSTRNSGSDILQDLNYYYDPVGNITDQRDDAQQTIFYANSMVEPHGAYTYDALYRLIQAEGREQIGQSNNPTDPKHEFIVNIAISPNDGDAMRRYIETYQYDALGNILEVKHQAGGGTAFQNNWTRSYFYNDPHPFQTGKVSNRLTKTTILGSNAVYTYDMHGNMTQMPHLPTMHWDFADQLQQVSLPNAEAEYYTYAAPNEKGYGERTRKVTEKAGGKRYDRIYLGGFEIYREYTATGAIELERETLHIMDDKSRIALIDTQTIKNQSPIANPQPLIRFQLSNHLGSATLELNAAGLLMSYEEYYPFGGSSYQAADGSMEASRKRYRYVGKELDEATGLYYYGARYYATWLGRWCKCDPLGYIDGYNVFQFTQSNPIKLKDENGTSSNEEEPSNKKTRFKARVNKNDLESYQNFKKDLYENYNIEIKESKFKYKKNKEEYVIKGKFIESTRKRETNDFSKLGRDIILNSNHLFALQINFKRNIEGSHVPHESNIINLDLDSFEVEKESKLYNIEEFKRKILSDEKDINFINNQIVVQFDEPMKITEKMQSDFKKTGTNLHITFIHELTHTEGSRNFLKKYFKKIEGLRFQNKHDDTALDVDFLDDHPIFFTNRVQEELATKKGTSSFLRMDHSAPGVQKTDSWYQFFLIDGIPVVQYPIK